MNKCLTLLIVSMLGLACLSCRKGFEHYSLLFEIPLLTSARSIPESRVQVVLLSIGSEQQKCHFRLTRADAGITLEEWVAVREFFQAEQWFGPRGLRLAEIRDGRVLLERFGSR
jgi:hypothetical protein